MHGLKNAVLRGLTKPSVARLFAPFVRGRAVVFMLHRFAQPELGVVGHDPEALRGVLAELRRQDYALLSLEEVMHGLAHGEESLARAVCFTIDDGYADHAEIAAPVFAEFDCPVTTFVCTGFLDGALWMWWDKIEFSFTQTRRTELSVDLGGEAVAYRWSDEAERLAAQLDLTERCKRITDEAKNATLSALAEAADVEIPAAPPRCYAPMTWDQLRACEARGMIFGPHTATHPVLSRTSDEQARREIEWSRNRLAEQAERPAPVFCYPNGQPGDFGQREFEILSELDFIGAVVGSQGYADGSGWATDPSRRFRVRRFSLPEQVPRAMQMACGIERVKTLVRGGAD